MPAAYIERIETLARQFRKNERNLTLYFPDFGTPPPHGNLNRVFGPPVGITADDWPTYAPLGELLHEADCLDVWDPCDARMEHVFTIDLAGVELLGAPRGARAMLLFISNATFHRACGHGNSDTSVVFLGREQVGRGLYQGPLPRRSQYRWSRRFSLARIDVPGDVFDVARDPAGADPQLVPLYEAIEAAPARLGGCPVWLRSEDTLRRWPPRPPAAGLSGRRGFVMQFRQRFAEVNLGNDGVMYVDGHGAYFQSR